MFTHKFAFHSLYRYISNLEVIDCHEHLHPEDVRNAQPVDFSSLISEYGYLDLLNAGMSTQQLGEFFNLATPLTRKRELFAPYLPAMDRILALALADKVADGTLTVVQAKRWARAILWDNPVRFYGLS